MKNITPMKAIRAKCIDCCGGNIYEPRYCTVERCPLHPYRLGKRPKRINDTAGDSSALECGAISAENDTERTDI